MIVTTAARRMAPAYPTITDDASYPPPTSGTYAYNSFTPPALGASYRDPVFGKLVRRLTDIGANASDSQNYSFHGINADGTLMFHKTPAGTFSIVSTVDGSETYTSQPVGLNASEVRWDMNDADKYYYFSGAALVRRNLAAQTNTTLKTFAATLEAMGGSQNYQSSDSRYFVVQYSGTAKLWDSQTDTIYSGSVTPVGGGGWIALSPSAGNIVTAAGNTAQPNKEHYAYSVNHGTQTISASPVQYWGISGDHSVIVSATDGKDYAVTFEANDTAGIWRCDLSVDVGGLTAAQQRALCTQLQGLAWADNDGHFSAVSRGAYRDWVFVEMMNGGDFNITGTWSAFTGEIWAVNVLTGARKRLAHHRSRGVSASYYTQPRVSCSVDGSFVFWASNMNDSTPTGYADLYGIANPLSS